MSMRKIFATSRQVLVDRDRFAHLKSLEFRHLGYLRAAEAMGLKAIEHRRLYQAARTGPGLEASYQLGWLDCLSTYNELALKMVQQVLDSHPGHDSDTAGPILKGQLCLHRVQGCMCLVIASEETT